MDQLALFFLLLLGTIVTVPLGDRLGLPAPVLMTILGGLGAMAPFVPAVDVPPEFILPLVLPPLLYSAVQRTSWRQFTANMRPIMLLAVALVFVTTAAVAAVAHAIVPGLPVAAAVALGALVAPPDPVAATAVAGKLGLPRRMVSILEGEGLFNDVTAIVVYHVAVAAVLTGTFSVAGAGLALVLSAVVALAVGLAVGFTANKAIGRLDDPTLQIGLTLLVPFVAYLIAEEFEGSGVLAVLVCALFLAEYASDADDVFGRLAAQTFWEVVETIVTGLAFGLIGLELSLLFGAVRDDWYRMLGAAATVVAVVVGVRLLWLLPATWVTRWLHGRDGAHDEAEEIPVSWRETVVMWWSGMRGVATVALAVALPLTLDDGKPFPGRDWMLFIAFAVVLSTLVVQGLTLPWLVGRLGVTADSAAERDLERELALRVTAAAKRRLKEISEAEDMADDAYELLHRRAVEMGVRISPDIVDEERREHHRERLQWAKRAQSVHAEMLSAARHEVLDARSEPGADPEVVDRVLRQLDVRSLRGGG
ncbi:Sodium, potassium, lithium and rubidium/H(+) antiporter [Streptomyces sp. RB5]|uniref:Sodium, potassium, lithium and rubidium/H(+) antiporter n=1 Tax=Streptomyces smaragdinus TaxID=2585196 RepID=A0A7K0CTF6_9ACTN|nr:Na+/H+ antiporter [Streptomyces smaragdinus]MQY16767.1 Sodium, potassium, lithium and rubidium/H(+) antiporter [Streptomyces smaragdinus]